MRLLHALPRFAFAFLALLSVGGLACSSLGAGRRASAGLATDTAMVFAPGVVSTGDVFASTFTPDGRIVVFTKFAPPKPATLMMSTLADGRWTTPVVLPFSGTYRDLDPSFTPDGARLYFSSGRPSGPSAADTTTGVDTWYVERLRDGWSSPARLPSPVNGAETDMYPSVTRSGGTSTVFARAHPGDSCTALRSAQTEHGLSLSV